VEKKHNSLLTTHLRGHFPLPETEFWLEKPLKKQETFVKNQKTPVPDTPYILASKTASSA